MVFNIVSIVMWIAALSMSIIAIIKTKTLDSEVARNTELISRVSESYVLMNRETACAIEELKKKIEEFNQKTILSEEEIEAVEAFKKSEERYLNGLNSILNYDIGTARSAGRNE